MIELNIFAELSKAEKKLILDIIQDLDSGAFSINGRRLKTAKLLESKGLLTISKETLALACFRGKVFYYLSLNVANYPKEDLTTLLSYCKENNIDNSYNDVYKKILNNL